MNNLLTGTLLAGVLLSGCTTMITVPVDPEPLSEDKATLLILHEQGFPDTFEIFMDRELLGYVNSKEPLKIEIEPGYHELYVKVPFYLDRITGQEFHGGRTYFLKVWMDFGLFVHSSRIDPTHEIDSYDVRVRTW